MTFRTLLVLAAALMIAAGPPSDELAKEYKKLDGDWLLVSGIDDGKKLASPAIAGTHLTFSGNTHLVTVGKLTYQGTHKLDPSKNPKTIDIMDTEGPFKGMTALGIYEISEDEFKVCYSVPGKDRPKDFIAKEGTGYRSHVWKREKK